MSPGTDPQVNIYRRTHDGKWQLCMWLPREHVMDWKDQGGLPRLVPSVEDYFVRERKTFDSLPEVISYLEGRFPRPRGEHPSLAEISRSENLAQLERWLVRYREADTEFECKLYDAAYKRQGELGCR